MFHRTPVAIALTIAFGGTAVVATQALAQTTPPAPTTAPAPQRVEITGSNIKRTQNEGAIPITVITREDIVRSGATSLSDVLQNISSAGVGGFSEQNTNISSGGGAAGISLRGLGASYTLVLVDSRRIASAGFGGATGVSSFTDLNTIPLSAIDRVEVLRGSASAIYGADAVAGVINIILRRDLKGGEAAVFGGATSRGDGKEARANIGYGFGDLASDKFNVLATFDVYKRGKIKSTDRKYSANADGTLLSEDLGIDTRSLTGNPGSFRTGTQSGTGAFTANSPWRAMPNCPTGSLSDAAPAAADDQYCLFNFLTFWDLLPATQRIGGLVKANFEISPSLSAFARLMLGQNDTTFNVAPTPLQLGVVAANAPGNSLGQAYQYRYRITANGPRVNNFKNDFQALVVGMQGQVGSFDWEAALNSSQNKNTGKGSGYANSQLIAAAARSGALAPYEFALNPSLEAAVAPTVAASYTRVGKAKSNGVDAKISGDIASLPAGPLSMAAGLEFRKESIFDRCLSPECTLGAGGTSVIDGANSTAAGGNRTQNAIYGELRGSVLKGLDLSLALRRDSYSGESSPNADGEVFKGKASKTVPQFGLEFRPIKEVLVRAVAGQGFKAPTLFEAYQARSESFNNGAAWRDQRRFPVTGNAADSGAVQVRNFRGGQPNLKPESSENYSVGIVLEPMADLSVSFDAWQIYLKETIGLPSVSRLLAREAVNGGSPLVIRTPATATDIAAGIPGSIEFINLQYANLGSTRIKGADMDLEYKWRTAEFGRFAVRTVWSHVTSYKQAPEPGVGLVEFAGTYEIPRFRASTSAKWESGPWDVRWAWRHTGNHGQDSQNTAEDKVANENYHDMSMAYTGFKNLTLGLGIRNIFDRQPAFANGDSQNFSYVFGDPRGRGYWLSLAYKF
jgi:iron complex outermembrane recepter protein